ncbi:hypothetical protein IPM19_02235 [bacterium]|nr:MAG: hypothetical protein IPM19_02235 [bacterium]
MTALQRSYPVHDLLRWIHGPNQLGCIRLYKENFDLFKKTQGSTNNHQAWPGGYHDHIAEIMNIGMVLYNTLSAYRKLSFTLSDVLLITFLHDVEKPFKYDIDEDGVLHVKPHLTQKRAQHKFRMALLKKYGIELNDMQLNAMKYVEGEGKDYSSRNRVMNELAALCHMADVASARIWYNHPAEGHDSWLGAKRCCAASPAAESK